MFQLCFMLCSCGVRNLCTDIFISFLTIEPYINIIDYIFTYCNRHNKSNCIIEATVLLSTTQHTYNDNYPWLNMSDNNEAT